VVYAPEIALQAPSKWWKLTGKNALYFILINVFFAINVPRVARETP
jgi:hypothetical protein